MGSIKFQARGQARGPGLPSEFAGLCLSGRLLFPDGLFEHVFRQDAVAAGGVVDQYVGDSPHQPPVLKDGRAAHE